LKNTKKASRLCFRAATIVVNAMVMTAAHVVHVKAVSTVAIAVIAAHVVHATTKLVKEHNHG
jgi:hypothetical protein